MNPNVNMGLVDGGVHLIPLDDPDLDVRRDRNTSSTACVTSRTHRLDAFPVASLQLQGVEDQASTGGNVDSSSLSSSGISHWMVDSQLFNSDLSFTKDSFEILRQTCKDCCQISSNILVEEACAINKCLVTMQYEIAMDESKQDKIQQKDPSVPKNNETDDALTKRKQSLLQRADRMKRASSLLLQLRSTQKELLNEFEFICQQRTSSEDTGNL